MYSVTCMYKWYLPSHQDTRKSRGLVFHATVFRWLPAPGAWPAVLTPPRSCARRISSVAVHPVSVSACVCVTPVILRALLLELLLVLVAIAALFFLFATER